MSKALLCSTGESVAIWEVGSGLEPVYQFDIGDGQSTWAGNRKPYPEYALIPVRSYCSPPPDCKRYVVINMLPSGWLVCSKDATMLS